MPRDRIWYLTEDLDDFLARGGDFLRSRPTLHTVSLTVADTLRTRGPHVYGARNPLYGVLGDETGGVRAALLHTPPHPVNLTPLAPGEAEELTAHLRGRGYAGAVTATVSRAARQAGAQEVLLFTDLANPTSNGLYQRIGYRPVADFAVYGFAAGE
ncbi:GNAT family N-acetyltransferase [Streptomyces sp. NPDC102462]|uniref:GNAT family N-acetyltransferase n=1 Tax=Streptomyces sp. NPDC102462 TaxID=3366178 RepID=UPI00381056AF